MTGQDLQKAAREAMQDHTQEGVAQQLGVSRGTIAAALNATEADRYQRILCRIVETFTTFSVEKQVRYVVTEKTA